uniref:Ubiquitin-like domain-containing protein n=1 Tax=Setaria digitata TaxID=48799 RepID=A0A915Q7W0_9BILA
MSEASGENVRLLIRCALQSFDDLPISCLSSWTVLQLKEKLAVDCPSKPEAKRQRLIYAGHCLHDEHTLKSVFDLRPIDDGNVHVIHLVCPPKDFTAHVGVSVLRKRNASHTQINSTSASSPSQVLNRNVNEFFRFYTNPFWASNAPQRGFVTVQPMLVSSNAQFQNAYQAYMMSYSNYMYQMMSALGNGTSGVPALSQPLLNNQQAVVSNLPRPPQQADQPQGAFIAEPDLAAAPAAGDIVQEAIAGDVDGQQRDFLDIIYKVYMLRANFDFPQNGAIRMCFLIMLVYVYSSAERFLGVLIFILLVWFIQARRDRNNRERENRELAAAVNNVRQPQQVDLNGNNADENTNETASTRIGAVEPREPTAWVIFWSTCYTFITSFFSSLIPDNPLPVNIN